MPMNFEEIISQRKKDAIARGAKRFLTLQDSAWLKDVQTMRADLVLVIEKKPPFYRWFVNAIALDD